MTKKLATALFIVGLGFATGEASFSLRAQVGTPAAPEPLSKAIVGLWRGEAIFCNNRTNFARTDIEIRFTAYGIMTVKRGPFSGCGVNRSVTDTFNADYMVVGHNVLVSLHVPTTADGELQKMSNISLVGDTWESLGGDLFLPTSFGFLRGTTLGAALIMKRQP